jgi:hypothetical protein
VKTGSPNEIYQFNTHKANHSCYSTNNVTTYIMNVFCSILNTIVVYIALKIIKLNNNGFDYELCAVENSKGCIDIFDLKMYCIM